MRCVIMDNSSKIGQLLERELKRISGVSVNTWNYEYDINAKNTILELTNLNPDIIYYVGDFIGNDLSSANEMNAETINYKFALVAKEIAKKCDSRLVYLSNALVFDGTKDSSYMENDFINPKNFYGISHAKAEHELLEYGKTFVVRYSWLVNNDFNYINHIIKKAKEKNSVTSYCNQMLNPTYINDFIKSLIVLSVSDEFGVYHLACNKRCSQEEYLQYLFKKYQISKKIVGVDTEDAICTIKPNNNISLNPSKLKEHDLLEIPDWQLATDRYLEDNKYRTYTKRFR